MSYTARLREMSSSDSGIPQPPVELPALRLEDALALLRRSHSRAEVAYARAILNRAISSEGLLNSHISTEDLEGGEMRPAEAAMQLLRESRTAFEATQAAKVLQRLVSNEENPAREKRSTGTSDSTPKLRLNKINVLVVEDDSNYRELLVRTLMKSGASVLTAADVTGAVEIIEKQRPDVIVSDINLPGQSGYKLMQWVQRQKAHIPVLAISGEPQDPGSLQRSGFRLFFAKNSGVPAQIVDSIAHMPEVAGPLLVGRERGESAPAGRQKAS